MAAGGRLMAILELSQVMKRYGALIVADQIDLELAQGEALGIIGPNGAGKTTLFNLIAGTVRVDAGAVSFAGRDIRRAAPETIARAGLALVPEGRGIFASLSVTENLTMAARPGSDGRRTWTLARIFELFPRLHQRRNNGGHQLSGGEQQMLTIGRALMTNPDLILIDEATEGLAPLVARDIWTTLGVIRGEGIATIVVDKDFRSLAKIVDRVVLLAKGAVMFDGAPGDLTSRPELLERHLGV